MDYRRGRRPWAYPLHTHEGFGDVIYLDKGTIEHEVNGFRHVVKAGQLLIVRASDQHSLKGEGTLYYNLNYLMEDFERVLSLLGKTWQDIQALSLESKVILVDVPVDKRATLLEECSRRFFFQNREDSNPMVISFLSYLCSDILFPPVDHRLGALPEWLSILVMNIQYSDGQMYAQDLPQIAHKSKEHISRSFKKYLGCTPSQFITKHRLKRAHLLLQHSDMSVAEIAHSVGFEQLNYFHTQFKKAFDCQPTQLRK